MPRKKKVEVEQKVEEVEKKEETTEPEITLFERVEKIWCPDNWLDLDGRFFHLLNEEEQVTARGMVVRWREHDAFCVIFRRVGGETKVQHRLIDRTAFVTHLGSPAAAAFYTTAEEMVAAESDGLVVTD